MSIEETHTKIKGFLSALGSDLVVALIIVFVGLSGFGLGRLSVDIDTDKNQPVRLINELGAQGASASASLENESGLIVVSKNGTKYHYPWCSGAKRMKEGNKIWFKSIEDARRAGYTPAANCKGLK